MLPHDVRETDDSLLGDEPERSGTLDTRLLDDLRGLSTVEYIIILVLIAVVAIVAWKQFGESVEYHVRDSTTQINNLGD
ncbi:MAG: hypothetical protein H6723_19895 [Sandaracinus sp.]|nr:hypothetical protein [Sandaracinus sp.]